jgi:hypothetical protein
MHDQTRLLHFPNLLNARDLGGYPTVDGAHTRWRSLVRADDLAQLTAEGTQALADYGIETVVDLRWPEEAALYPSPVPAALPQVRYQRISLLTHTEDEWRLRSRDVAKELWKCVVLEHVRFELHHVLSAIAAHRPVRCCFTASPARTAPASSRRCCWRWRMPNRRRSRATTP